MVVPAANEGVVYVEPVPNRLPPAAAVYQAVLFPEEDVNVVVPPQLIAVVPVITGCDTFEFTVTGTATIFERQAP
jgi:hypothetical protein